MPIACRKSDITMITRTKEVIIINKDGSSVNTVIKINTCNVKLYSVAPLGSSVILTNGKPVCAKSVEFTKKHAQPKRTTFKLRGTFIDTG